jgi:hypothetical protein
MSNHQVAHYSYQLDAANELTIVDNETDFVYLNKTIQSAPGEFKIKNISSRSNVSRDQI